MFIFFLDYFFKWAKTKSLVYRQFNDLNVFSTSGGHYFLLTRRTHSTIFSAQKVFTSGIFSPLAFNIIRYGMFAMALLVNFCLNPWGYPLIAKNWNGITIHKQKTEKNAFLNAIRVKIISSYLLARVTVKHCQRQQIHLWSGVSKYYKHSFMAFN